MNPPEAAHQDLLLSLADAWGRLERQLDAYLANARGVRFSEYRLLRTLAASWLGDVPDDPTVGELIGALGHA